MTDTVTFTPTALTHFEEQLKTDPKAIGIRLGVKDAGCSGKAYTIDFAYEKADDDKVCVFEGCTFYIDPESFNYLQGMQVDRVQEGLNAFLKFNNPNVTGTCGCGESFTVDKKN